MPLLSDSDIAKAVRLCGVASDMESPREHSNVSNLDSVELIRWTLITLKY